MSKEELMNQQAGELLAEAGAPLGFEDEEQGDMLIPRVKIIQSLSPERKDKLADEGDIINSLTLEKLNGKPFVPVFKFNNNILWKDRSLGGGIECIARDGKTAQDSTGKCILCAACRKNEFDNSKQGKDAIPTCTKYINFFGFFEGERMPIILSFAKTNYAEGKKLFSLAKVTMKSMFAFKYSLDAKLMKKNNNEWYNIVATPAGPTSAEDIAFASELYKQFRNMNDLSFDYDSEGSAPAQPDANNTEY